MDGFQVPFNSTLLPEIVQVAVKHFSVTNFLVSLVVLLLAFLLLYLLFDRIVKIGKFILFWAPWSYGMLGLLRVEPARSVCLMLFNKMLG